MPFSSVSLRVAAVVATLHAHETGAEQRSQRYEQVDEYVAVLQVPPLQEAPEAMLLRLEEVTDAVRPVWMTDSFLRVTQHTTVFDQIPVSMRVAAASTAAAIFTTVNDIPWFLPFALHIDRWRFVGVYMLAKEVVVLAAVLLAGMAAELAATFPGFPIQRFLLFLASFFMATYALMLFSEEKRLASSPVEDKTQLENAKDAPTLKEVHLLTASKVAIISTLGNVDSLGIFVPGLQQGLFTLMSLLVSTALFSCLVGASCIGLGQLIHIGNIVNVVPIWFILLLLATWSAIEGFLV